MNLKTEPEIAVLMPIYNPTRHPAFEFDEHFGLDRAHHGHAAIAKLVRLAQVAFNSFIRARDADKPCISCGKPLQAATVGGGFDCGHYRSVGSAVHMRFVEDNAHGQCKYCNRHLAGNHVAYRAGLIERVGLRSVELIESDQTLRKYAKEGLIEIARHYNAEKRRLEATA